MQTDTLIPLLVDLIRRTATELPPDILDALIQAQQRESRGGRADFALTTILKNLQIARTKKVPLCQDTGFPCFYVRRPVTLTEHEIREAILAAVREATSLGYLRPNAVTPLAGKNSGDNTGEHFPAIYFEEIFPDPSLQKREDLLEVDLILKGGGSENVSDQISLPAELSDYGAAGRNLEGVQKAVLQIVKNAQGFGCAPGILSVHIGSDRAGGYTLAKKGLLKKIGEHNPDAALAQLEAEILHAANALEIGPMGFGGRTTLLDCHVSMSHRHPASFFVTVAYMCWASRRSNVKFKMHNEKWEVVAVDSSGEDVLLRSQNPGRLSGRPGLKSEGLIIPTAPSDQISGVQNIQFPITEDKIRQLRIGDLVSLSGRIFLGRDQVHAFAAKHELPKDLHGSAVYHCGPVAVKNAKCKIKNEKNDEWRFLAAGPTTSIREEPYEADFIAKTGVRAVIGKGGMGQKTLTALQKHGAVYLHAIGGAAAFYADTVQRVVDVALLEEFGTPEALWEIEVEGFLAVVTMDSHGGSLH